MTTTYYYNNKRIYKWVDTIRVNVSTQEYMVTVSQCGEIDSRKYEYIKVDFVSDK